MTELADPRLSAWGNFYVIVGSAGAALIAVQFVVITLIASMRQSASEETIGAFGTPTVVSFSSALLISALMSAPWPSLVGVSVALAVCGFGGLLYGALVIRRALRQTGYHPVLEDWVWYATLPCCSYAALAASSLLLRRAPHAALFMTAASALSLLLIGIHNAWDTVTHLVTGMSGSEQT